MLRVRIERRALRSPGRPSVTTRARPSPRAGTRPPRRAAPGARSRSSATRRPGRRRRPPAARGSRRAEDLALRRRPGGARHRLTGHVDERAGAELVIEARGDRRRVRAVEQRLARRAVGRSVRRDVLAHERRVQDPVERSDQREQERDAVHRRRLRLRACGGGCSIPTSRSPSARQAWLAPRSATGKRPPSPGSCSRSRRRGALVVAWRGQDRLRLAPLLALAIGFQPRVLGGPLRSGGRGTTSTRLSSSAGRGTRSSTATTRAPSTPPAASSCSRWRRG